MAWAGGMGQDEPIESEEMMPKWFKFNQIPYNKMWDDDKYWLPALLHKNQLIIMGTIWTILATLSTIIIGFLIFHEKLTVLQWVGVLLSFLALILVGST